MVQKVRTKKFKKFKIFIYIRYTPRLYLILKLSANSFITNTLDTVKLFKKKKIAKGVVNHIIYRGVHQFMPSMSRYLQDHFGVKISSKSARCEANSDVIST